MSARVRQHTEGEDIEDAARAAGPKSFEEVYLDELTHVEILPHVEGPRVAQDLLNRPADQRSLTDVQDAALSKDLCGLAISGGGIRSATFGLGVLQGLAKANLLERFHYLSTVSGGGYIGSFLSKWIRTDGIDKAIDGLVGSDEPSEKLRIHTRNCTQTKPIKHLRNYSNYLAPIPGVFSYDGWLLLAIYLRNLLLNQLVLVLGVMSLMVFCRLIVEAFCVIPVRLAPITSFSKFAPILVAGAAVALLFTARLFRASELRGFQPMSAKTKGGADAMEQLGKRSKLAKGFWRGSIFFILLLAMFTACFFQATRPQNVLIIALAAIVSGLAAAFCKADAVKQHLRARLLAGAFSGALCGSLVVVCLRWTTQEVASNACFSVPAILIALVAGKMLYAGLAGGALDELEREWWSSVNSRYLLIAALWGALSSIAVFSPWLFGQMLNEWGPRLSAMVGTAGIGAVASGILAAQSAATGADKKTTVDLLAKLAPAAFLLVLLVAIAIGTAWVLYDVSALHNGEEFDFLNTLANQSYFIHLNRPTQPLRGMPIIFCLFIATIVLLLASFVLGQRVGANRFSLHNMYANRLVRCYLGATTDPRFGNALTNFDSQDEIALSTLWPGEDHDGNRPGPFHIVNGAMNLSSERSSLGAEPEDYAAGLANRDRKAESFSFSPIYCGSESTGYRKSSDFAGNIKLGDAVAASGAAVSPNMGYHSSPAITALLTVFNLRLGAWFGNPSRDKYKNADPSMGWKLLISELIGSTDMKRDHVYVSDGGHFENVGVYELLRRRCRFIVAVDADPAPNVRENIGRLVRLARIDFGVRVEIDPAPITPDEQGRCQAHLVVGRIHYGDVNQPKTEQPPHNPDFDYDNNQGILIWIALAVTGDEPGDVQNYRKMHEDFPYRTTGDQFFDENEFESYRELGEHSVESMLTRFSLDHEQEAGLAFTLEHDVNAKTYSENKTKSIDKLNDARTRDIFKSIFDQWLAQPKGFQEHFVQQNEQYGILLERLKSDPRLAQLAKQIYGVSTQKPKDAPAPEEREFVERIMVGQMLALLENVWLSLDLEQHFLHPVHRGWLGVFNSWTNSACFKANWYDSDDSAKDGLRREFNPVFQDFIEIIRRRHDKELEREQQQTSND